MIDRLNPGRRYSDAVTHNGVVYAVEVPVSETADIRNQTREVLAALDATLALANSSKERLLMATLYLTDMADYEGMNAEWESWLPIGAAPSRACVQVCALAHPGWRIEIAATAAVLG
ncbi:MAG: RidA family protein [Betaproteobacteria bacterium]|nr:RidA family protein [Betaproteobacteria bacterium]